MSIASRHGKLALAAGEDEALRLSRREDHLVADVFGAYRYLPVALGVGRLLASATRGGVSLEDWLSERAVTLAGLTRCVVTFWPPLAGREPDVLLELGSETHTGSVVVLVEAKLHSPQHEIEGLSQLGFYASRLREKHPDGVAAAVFLTSDTYAPESQLARAESEAGPAGPPIFWTSWRHLLAEAIATRRDSPPTWAHLLDDLAADLRERGISARRYVTDFPMPPTPPLANASTLRSLRWARRRLAAFAPLDRLGLQHVEVSLRSWSLT